MLISLLDGRSSFIEESVRYIYKKQLEEADLLILNKTDLITAQQLSNIDGILKSEYPGKIILHQNSFTQQDISRWLEVLREFTESSIRTSLIIDYDLYGEGESKLAWLDKSITIHTSNGDAIRVAAKIIGFIFDQIQILGLVIGHLKFFLETTHYHEKISFTTTSTSADIKLKDLETDYVTLLINARVETEPDTLENLIDEILIGVQRMYGCDIVAGKWTAFRPGYPRPTYRL